MQAVLDMAHTNEAAVGRTTTANSKVQVLLVALSLASLP